MYGIALCLAILHTAQVDMYFISGRMVVFSCYTWGRSRGYTRFHLKAKEANGRLNENKSLQSFFFSTNVGWYTPKFMSLLQRHLLNKYSYETLRSPGDHSQSLPSQSPAWRSFALETARQPLP